MRVWLAAAALLAAFPAQAADWVVELSLPARMLDANAWGAPETKAASAHVKQVQALLANGKAAFAGRSLLQDAAGNDDAAAFGVIVLTGMDRAEAEATTNADAAVQAGVMNARLHPFYIVPKPGEARRGETK